MAAGRLMMATVIIASIKVKPRCSQSPWVLIMVVVSRWFSIHAN